MARVCSHHPFLLSKNLCGRCGAEFCGECLVHPRGQKLPMCVTCAVAAGGANPGTKALSRRKIRSIARARATEVAAAAPPPLPVIENPVPSGFAFGEAEEIDRSTPAGASRRGGRRRNRDLASREAAPREAASRDAAPEGPRDDMMSWLDSVYATEPTE